MEITPENRDKIIELLREGICPICEKKFVNPLTHISRMHGISRFELKDKIMIGQQHGFASPELSKKRRQSAIKNNTVEKLRPSQVYRKKPKDFSEKMRFLTSLDLKSNPKHLEIFKKAARVSLEKAVRVSAEKRGHPVVRISMTGENKTYNSISDAARDVGISYQGICRVLKGQNKTAAGYKWEYFVKKH